MSGGLSPIMCVSQQVRYTDTWDKSKKREKKDDKEPIYERFKCGRREEEDVGKVWGERNPLGQ